MFVMDRGWKRLPLLVVFLLFWRNIDGFKGGVYSNAHRQWGQPSDTFSPRAVQSSMSDAHVPGILPVEEVGSSVFPNKPLKSRPKFNLLQFVKGGSSSSQSASHAQTAPSSSVSTLPLSVQPSSSLTSSGSMIPGAASGLSLETQYVASGFGPLVSTQGERSSYPAQLGVSGRFTSDGLHLSSSREASVHQSAEASLPVFSQGSISHSSSSAPGATSTSQSSPILSGSLGQPVSSQGEGGYSGLSQGASSLYAPDSNTEDSSSAISSQSTGDQSSPSLFSSSSQDSSGTLLASGSSFLEEVAGLSPLVDLSESPETSSQLLSLVASSQSTNGQSSPSVHTASPQSSSGSESTDATSPLLTQGSVSYTSLSSQAQGSAISQGSSGDELSASSVQSIPTQIGSGHYSGASQSLSAPSLHTPESLISNKLYALPLGVYSQSTSSGSSYRAVSPVGSLSQMGASGPFTSRGNDYSRLLPQSQATSSQYAVGYSKPFSSTQSTSSQSTSVLNSRKQYTSASQGSSGAQFGASAGFASQGMSSSYSDSVQSQGTSQFALASQSSAGVSLSSPQAVAGPTTVQSSRKQFTSAYQGSSGAQFGTSTGFPSEGVSSHYSGSVQSQGTKSQFASGFPSSHPSLLSSPQAVAGPITVQSSRKQFTSTFAGSSAGTQAGSSTPFTLQGSTAYGGSPQPQATVSQFAPGSPSHPSLLSSPQAVAGPITVQSSRKQFTSTFTGSAGTQAGSSTPFTLQGSTAYGGSPQPQATVSQFAPGSLSHPSLLSSPQAVAGPITVQSSRKQFTSTFTGSSAGTQAGSSTPFTLQGSTAYGGSSQPPATASQFAPGSQSSYARVSLFPPQAGPSTAQVSRKQFTSTFTGSAGTQAGSSTPFTLQGSTTYGGSPQPPATASQFAPGSQSSYARVSPFSPQAGPSTAQVSRKQFTSTFTGSAGTQAGSSTPFTLQGSTTYGGSPQPQATVSQFAPGSPSHPSLLSSPQVVAGPTTVQSSKQFTSTFTGSSAGTQAGSSTPFTLQGSTAYGGSPQPPATASQFAPGSQSSYARVSLFPPQAGPSTAQVSRKQFTSTFTGSAGTQAGSSTPFTLQGSTAYGGSPQPPATASQFAPGSQSSYARVSPFSPQAGPSTAQVSRKQFTSTFTGSAGTQAGSSTPFTLQGSTTYGGSPQPQATVSQFAPGSPSHPSLLSSPQVVAGPTTVQSSKQFTSTFTGSAGTQAGSSTPFTLQGSTAYGGSPQPPATASQFAPGSQSSYARVSLFPPQAGPSTAQVSRKQFTSTFTGSAGTQAGSSTPFTLQGSTTYGGSPQPQATVSQFAPGSPSHPSLLSSPQAVAGPTTVQSSKQFTSAYQGSSGAQFGTSTGFPSEGVSSHYSGSVQSQGTTSQFAPGFSSPYANVWSSPQSVASQSSRVYRGSSVSQSQKSQRWQPSAARWTQSIQTSNAAASQTSSSFPSSPAQLSSLSSTGGSSSGVFGPLVSEEAGTTRMLLLNRLAALPQAISSHSKTKTHMMQMSLQN